MFSQELLESLPNDPEDAFGVFEMEIRSKIPPIKELNDHDEQRSYDLGRAQFAKEYVLALAAFVSAYDFDIGVDFDELMQLGDYSFINKFEEASNKIKFFSNKCAIKLAQRKKSGTTCIYVLEDAAKIKIQKFIGKIREIILKADLTDMKKDALVKRLNAFGLEVDKDRTSLEAYTALYVATKKELKEVKEIIEPLEKIWSTVASGGKELWKALPTITIKGFLNEPPKKIEDKSKFSENFQLDDEIPF